MASEKHPVNLLANPSFEAGEAAPDGWEWMVKAGRPIWSFDEACAWAGGRSIRILQDVGHVHGEFRQRVTARPGARYRLRGCIRVALEGTGINSGANLSARQLRAGEILREAPLRPFFVGRHDWRLWTAEFVAEEGVDEIEVSFDMRDSDGAAWFDALELYEVPQPLEASVRPAEARLRAGRCMSVARTVRVLADEAPGFFVNDVLKPLVGAVEVGGLGTEVMGVHEDAVVVYGRQADRALDLDALLSLAARRLVVLTPAAFEYAARDGGVRAGVSEHMLLAPCARIERDNALTRGFRQGDVIPWWSDRGDTGTYVQQAIQADAGALERLGFETVATCVTRGDGDGLAAILWRPTAGGGVLVMDLDMLDARPRYTADANPALVILSNALGRPQTLMGTWVVPGFDYDAFVEDLHALAARHRSLVLKEEGRSGEGRPIYSLSVGDDAKPAFFADAGIHPYEWAPCFGLPVYAARLADEYAAGMPWARAMLEEMRFKCVPVFAPDGWERNQGMVHGVNLNRNFPTYWENHAGADKGPAPLSQPECRVIDRILREDNVAAAVSWHETSANTNWVGMPGYGGRYKPYAAAIPAVFRQFIDGASFYWQASLWTQVTDPRNFQYHYTDSHPYLRDYSVSRSPFLLHHSASLGVTSFLVEQYGNSEIYHSATPQRTDMTCRIVETLFGLQTGLVCRNCGGEDVAASVPLFAPGADAEATVYSQEGREVERRPLVAIGEASLAEGVVPPGGCLVVRLESAPWKRARGG